MRHDCPELFSGTLALMDEGETGLAERVRRAMEQAGGRRTEAARLLGVSRSTLWRWQTGQERGEG